MNLKLSVIIVNWNVSDLLCACLDSLKDNLAKYTYEVIVIDNYSSDESVAKVKQYYPWVTLIENKVNQGFARANNQGFKIANGEYILILNPDTVVKSGSIQRMIRILEVDPAVGMVGPKIIDEFGRITPPCKRSAPSLLKIFHNYLKTINFPLR